MRVVVYSEVRLFGEALADCLAGREGIVDVCPCYLAQRLVTLVLESVPDIVLVDVTGEQAVREARTVYDASPQTPIVALALPEFPEDVIACADAGFIGYAPRQASLGELVAVMRMALMGEWACHPKVAGRLLREVRQRRGSAATQPPNEPLTKRECEVLRLLSRGLSNKEIARELVLSVATVKNHLHNIFAKMRVTGRAQALARLRNEPWLERSEPWSMKLQSSDG